VTEALIAEVGREAARHQAEMLVMSVPWPAQLLPDPKAREAFAARAGVPDLSYPDRRLQAFGQAQAFRCSPWRGDGRGGPTAGRSQRLGNHLGIGRKSSRPPRRGRGHRGGAVWGMPQTHAWTHRRSEFAPAAAPQTRGLRGSAFLASLTLALSRHPS
jgi:hypothetical protein